MKTWEARAAAYDRSFGKLCAGPIDRLLDDTGSGSLLDAGCGTGTLGARAESRGRTVTAFDAEASMIGIARDRLRGPAIQAALPELPMIDGAFDAVAANFVINHVGRPADSVAELARVTRSGGLIAMTAWPAPPAGGWGDFVGSIFRAADVVPIPSQNLDRSLDFERSIRGLGALAEMAGCEISAATELHWVWSIRPDDLWAGVEGGIAVVGATYLAQSPAIRRAVKDLFLERCSQATSATGELEFPTEAVYVLAKKP
ncbi:class I SAM-dependent methyltransferase [Brachybacterium sp. UMB0905]|uniref:class I SAM-dependent methyltransferase n=1 Tax=Brachybacterium sp. UMB0905 TaxID=2069310 RepID=UPI000C807648|nr:class I SAM-dependent methyltransferase [Brachybacterium sp. UMB0905]PMC76783.1 SAM-dependent methyltransferase [Brachybacterium sp. UMB0905]